MKKKIALLTAIAMMASFATGCKSDESSSGSASTDAPSITTENITLKVWESVDGPDKWIQQAGAKFTEKYPNIKIEYVNVESGDSTSAIALDGPAGTGPDLFAAPHDKLGELVSGGHILKTTDEANVKSAVLGACSQALTYSGSMYGYPTSAETYALFYNKDLVPEADVPKTWDDMIKWCESFNSSNSGSYGLVLDVTSMYYTILFSTLNGNRLFGASGTDTSSSYLATADSIEGFKVFQKLRGVLNIASADMGTNTADGAFAAGTAAMHISGPWNVSNFKDAGLNFGVTTLPSLDGKTPAASFSGTRGMFVSAYSDHPVEANLFGQFLISDEMQALRYSITGALPSIETELSGEFAEYSAGFVAQLDYAFPMPSLPNMSAFWESSGAASSNIWDGADVESELKTLDSVIIA